MNVSVDTIYPVLYLQICFLTLLGRKKGNSCFWMNKKPLPVIPVQYFKNLYLKDLNLPPSNLMCSYHRIDPVESCAIWEHVQGLFWFAVGGDIAWLKYVVFYQQYTVYDSDLQDDHFELHLLCVEIFLRFWIFETQKIIPIKSICFCDVTMENSPQTS